MHSPLPAQTRRQLLTSSACGFGYLALRGLLDQTQARAASPGGLLAAQTPHHEPRAKRIIFIFMQGGPSHVDTYDYKPRLVKDDGKKLDFHNARSMKVVAERVLASPWKFAQHGQCGRWVSELFPQVARHVDDLCFIRSVHTKGVAHGPATLFLHTGAMNFIRPSVGSWINYGLGTENQNLPGFVTIQPSNANGGPRNFSNAFLPTIYQGTALGRAGLPIGQASFRHAHNDSLSLAEQRRQLDFLQSLNAEQVRHRLGGDASRSDDELAAVVESFELAFRMQAEAPHVLDMSGETKETLRLYGIGEKATDEFGRQCLLARRFAEAGVRYIQVSYADNGTNPRWDQHSNLKEHEKHALATDQPVAGLLEDLKARGLLEDTLVWWGGEFGRTPFAQGRDGRDHNPTGFTIWLAGGGVKPGMAYGETDEYGLNAAVDKVHMHDVHATMLHLLGLDHEQLSYRYAGRDFRLTDVHGRVVREIFA
jgi:hypothetical protein